MKHLPDVLVIGAARCGTSSLHANLVKHPNIRGPSRDAFLKNARNHKEVHFFDKNIKWRQGINYYRKFFVGPPAGIWFVESTPNYLYEVVVPERVKEVLPKARFIAMLRDPADRAWSHFCNWRRKHHWSTDILLDTSHVVVKKGFYYQQLKRWFEHFNRERFFIIRSEDFFKNPDIVIKETLDWIGVPEASIGKVEYWDPVKLRKGNPPMPKDLKNKIKAIYKTHNEKLEDLLERSMSW